ncbi:MAG: tRNA threonylcarbamoyladenosine dehydratase [Anaerotignaceae bacterium]
MNRFIRTEMIIGSEGLDILKNSKVIIFGVGGVGGYICEALARAGVGNLTLVDNDVVSKSNINRQIIALNSTIGRYKTEVMKERILDINPDCVVKTHNIFYLPESEGIIEGDTNYIVDAIDTVSGKIQLVLDAKAKNIPIISSMGTGNKLNPTQLTVTDIYKTSVCPLAKVMRKELKDRGIKKLKVVYSKEQPLTGKMSEEDLNKRGETSNKRRTPGSISFVPPVAGLIIASEVVKDLLEVANHG